MSVLPHGFKVLQNMLAGNEMFKYVLIVGFLLSGLVGCSEQASDDDFKITLRMSHVFSPKEDLAISLETAANNIFDKSNGAVKILTYPQGQIATYKDGVEMVVRGAYFISVEDPSYIGDYVPEFTALVGPMLYRNYEEYTSLVKTPPVQGWIEKASPKGIKVLSLESFQVQRFGSRRKSAHDTQVIFYA